MEISEILILLFLGLVSGIINTLAGGGSLITLPVMIFMGIPPIEANGTNRIQLIFQNISLQKLNLIQSFLPRYLKMTFLLI